ncbi:MAG: flagellar biosynthetic protein FliR [Spirochaetales bacterium]|jgi:flagellar biosynthetic protein FliR|nr:flagellar biosynthetic protein FliR [Spirochaetales bacterium]
MSLDYLVLMSHVFFLIFARIAALIFSAPLFSTEAVPAMAKVALSLLTAVLILPGEAARGYVVPDTALMYVGFVVCEILIGLILGFLLQVYYAAFQLAGQFFALQMGFAASQIFDPLSQVELPLVGLLFNLMAMYVFLTGRGFHQLFFAGIQRSFETIRPYDFFLRRELLFDTLLRSIGELFSQALLISLPILGTLFLVSASMGLLAKAAPQMNLLMISFPINIFIGFLLLFLMIPLLMESFGRIIDFSFTHLLRLMTPAGGGP